MTLCFKLIYDEYYRGIFGENFVKRNRNKSRIIYNNKEYPLKQFMNEVFEKVEDSKAIKIKIRFFHNIINLGEMFSCCRLKSMEDEKLGKICNIYDDSITDTKESALSLSFSSNKTDIYKDIKYKNNFYDLLSTVEKNSFSGITNLLFSQKIIVLFLTKLNF